MVSWPDGAKAVVVVIIGDLVGKRMNTRWLPEFSHCLEVKEHDGSRVSKGSYEFWISFRDLVRVFSGRVRSTTFGMKLRVFLGS